MGEPLKDEPTMEGHVTITAVYKDGTREVLVDRKNQIVNGFLLAVSNLITQKSTGLPPEQYAVNSMWMEASDTAYTQGVSAGDTVNTITATIVKRYVFNRDSDIDIEVGGDPGLVEYRAVLETGEANGSTIRAIGLYSQGDNAADPSTSSNVMLLARQLIGAFEKTPDFALDFTWRIRTKID